MIRTLTATEVKGHHPSPCSTRFARRGRGGEEVEITKHGRPVARLVPARGASALRGKLAGVALSSADDEALLSTGEAWELR